MLATEVCRAAEAGGKIAPLYRSAMERPLVGPPRIPARLRVASAEVAAALDAVVGPGTRIVHAATPELSAIEASMRKHFEAEEPVRDDREKYFPRGVAHETVAAFFEAAARLYRAKPWKVVPFDTALITLRSRALGIDGLVVSVVGQLGQSHAIQVFASRDAFAEYMDAMEAHDRGAIALPPLPTHTSLNFDATAAIPADVLAEVTHRGLALESADAYPWLMQIERDALTRSIRT